MTSTLLSELVGHPAFGRAHPLTLELAALYYSGAKPVENGDAMLKQEEKIEKELLEKQRNLEQWADTLAHDEEQLEGLKVLKQNLENHLNRVTEVEVEERQRQTAPAKLIGAIGALDKRTESSAALKSIATYGDDMADDAKKEIQIKQAKLQEKSRALEDEKLSYYLWLARDSNEYLKANGLHEVAMNGNRVPYDRPIPLNELKKYDSGFEHNAVIMDNSDVCQANGYAPNEVIVKEFDMSYSLEIPALGGEPIMVTCSGSNKNQTLKRLMEEIQKVLVSFSAE